MPFAEAAEVAATRVSAVGDDPAERLALARSIYDGPTGGAPAATVARAAIIVASPGFRFPVPTWGKKWGKKPHRSQPIPADLDLAKTA